MRIDGFLVLKQQHRLRLIIVLIPALLLVQALIRLPMLYGLASRLSSSSSSLSLFAKRASQSPAIISRYRPLRRSFFRTTPSCSLSADDDNYTNTNNMASQYWNREEYESSSASFRTTHSDLRSQSKPPVKEARIVSLSFPNDPNNLPLERNNNGEDEDKDDEPSLPPGARLLQVGGRLEDLDLEMLQREKANVVFVSPGVTSETLAGLIAVLPSLEWIHSRSAGIDLLMSEELKESKLIMTNAKGAFSSTLAEYTMLACSYFAKDLPQLLRNKENKNWKKYSVLELRGSTIGIVGYGDIGRAAAKLAKAYGMKVIALKRKVPSPEAIEADPYCDVVYGTDLLNQLFRESDYVLCSAPLTEETHKMIGKEQFDNAKEDCVFINVGRGPVVDEDALIEALKDSGGRLKGAGLDVFTKEPLAEDSELWTLDNVLLSP